MRKKNSLIISLLLISSITLLALNLELPKNDLRVAVNYEDTTKINFKASKKMNNKDIQNLNTMLSKCRRDTMIKRIVYGKIR